MRKSFQLHFFHFLVIICTVMGVVLGLGQVASAQDKIIVDANDGDGQSIAVLDPRSGEVLPIARLSEVGLSSEDAIVAQWTKDSEGPVLSAVLAVREGSKLRLNRYGPKGFIERTNLVLPREFQSADKVFASFDSNNDGYSDLLVFDTKLFPVSFLLVPSPFGQNPIEPSVIRFGRSNLVTFPHTISPKHVVINQIRLNTYRERPPCIYFATIGKTAHRVRNYCLPDLPKTIDPHPQLTSLKGRTQDIYFTDVPTEKLYRVRRNQVDLIELPTMLCNESKVLRNVVGTEAPELIGLCSDNRFQVATVSENTIEPNVTTGVSSLPLIKIDSSPWDAPIHASPKIVTPTPTLTSSSTYTATVTSSSTNPSMPPVESPASPLTPVIMPTVTLTPSMTATVTQAVTPTATQAVTPTATQAVTPTATQAVTPTTTPAMTPTTSACVMGLTSVLNNPSRWDCVPVGGSGLGFGADIAGLQEETKSSVAGSSTRATLWIKDISTGSNETRTILELKSNVDSSSGAVLEIDRNGRLRLFSRAPRYNQIMRNLGALVHYDFDDIDLTAAIRDKSQRNACGGIPCDLTPQDVLAPNFSFASGALDNPDGGKHIAVVQNSATNLRYRFPNPHPVSNLRQYALSFWYEKQVRGETGYSPIMALSGTYQNPFTWPNQLFAYINHPNPADRIAFNYPGDFIMSGDAGTSALSNPQILLTEAWNHLLVTFDVDVSDSRYYENGILRSQKWGGYPLNLDSDASLFLWTNLAGARNFDSVTLFDRSITPSEVASIYEAGVGCQLATAIGSQYTNIAVELKVGVGITLYVDGNDVCTISSASISSNNSSWKLGDASVVSRYLLGSFEITEGTGWSAWSQTEATNYFNSTKGSFGR